MGHQIIKQPDGRLAVFSSVVDDWIIRDATQQELEDHYAEEAAKKAREDTRHICEAVLADNARSVYFQFAKTFDEANAEAQWNADD
jgi:hypothetical protein